MPIPVSRTSTTVPVGVSIALIVTLPWCEVNFTALLTRLWTMWRRLRASNTTCIKRSTCEVTVSSFWLAAAAFSESAASTASATRQGAGWSSSRPAWIWVRSRMSLIRLRSWRPLLWIVSANSARSACDSSGVVWMISEKPMIAFSGVRSSCDMLVRNSDFIRSASCNSRLARCNISMVCRSR